MVVIVIARPDDLEAEIAGQPPPSFALHKHDQLTRCSVPDMQAWMRESPQRGARGARSTAVRSTGPLGAQRDRGR